MNINWYPGHMKKSLDRIRESLKLVDIAAVLLDARIPFSSNNPIIEEILKDKERVYLLNKMDLADVNENKRWIQKIEESGHPCIGIDARDPLVGHVIEQAAREELMEKRKRNLERNITGDSIRIMVVGIPNIGKSTLINTMSGRKGARVGNKPGVTQVNQWIRKGNVEFLDTPGVLWPKFSSDKMGQHLAFTQGIKDDILDIETLALRLIEELVEIAPQELGKRYDLTVEGQSGVELMDLIGQRRGCLLAGGYIDYSRVAHLLLDDFRKGRLGRITLERVDHVEHLL